MDRRDHAHLTKSSKSADSIVNSLFSLNKPTGKRRAMPDTVVVRGSYDEGNLVLYPVVHDLPLLISICEIRLLEVDI